MEMGNTGKEQILLYTKDAEKAEKIRALGSIYHIDVRELTLDMLNCTVMSVASGETKASNAKTELPLFYSQPELMIFCGLSREGLDVFLKAYREAKIEPIPLKAVMTPFNSLWSIYELTQELIKEHRAMNK